MCLLAFFSSSSSSSSSAGARSAAAGSGYRVYIRGLRAIKEGRTRRAAKREWGETVVRRPRAASDHATESRNSQEPRDT